MRIRNLFMLTTFVIASLLFTITDPDTGWISNLPFGASTIATFTQIFMVFIWIPVLHFARKFLLDYDTADFNLLGKNARRSPEGSGSMAIAVSIMTLAFSVLISAVILSVYLSGLAG